MSREHLQSSPQLVAGILKGSGRPLEEIHLPVVDVRDVARAHVAALESALAAGRYLLVGQDMWLKDVAAILEREYRPSANRAPRKLAGRWQEVTKRILSKPGARAAAAGAAVERRHSSTKAERELRLSFHSAEDTVLDTARSFVSLGCL